MYLEFIKIANINCKNFESSYPCHGIQLYKKIT